MFTPVQTNLRLLNDSPQRDIAAILILCVIGLILHCEAKPPKKISTASRHGRGGWGAARDTAYLGMALRAFLVFRANVLLKFAILTMTPRNRRHGL